MSPRGASASVPRLAAAAAGFAACFAYYREHPLRFAAEGPLLPAPDTAAMGGAGAGALASFLAGGAGLLFTAAAAAAAGELAGGTLWRRATRLERALLAQGLGLALVAGAAFALGEAGALRREWLAAAAGTCLLAWGARRMRRRGRAAPPPRDGERAPAAPEGRARARAARAIPIAAGGLALLFLLVTLLFAAPPLTANDALVYHLRLPALYLQSESTAPPAWNAYARMPHNMELLYTASRALGSESSPRWLDWWMRVILLGAAFACGRRLLPRAGAWVAPALLAGTPLLSDPRTVGNTDAGLSAFIGLALLAWCAGDDAVRRRALLAGVFLGIAAGMRYTGLALAGCFAVLWIAGEPRGRRAGTLLALGGSCALAVAPWFLRGELRSGNPVYPLAWNLFGGAEWSAALSERLISWQRGMGMGRDPLSLLLLPWNVSVHGQNAQAYRFFDGVTGPFYLALGAFWAAGARTAPPRERALALFALAGFALWAAGPHQVRFAMPLLLPGALLAAAGVTAPGTLRAGRAAAWALLAAAGLGAAAHLGALAVRAGREAVPVLAGAEPRESYLERRLPSYAIQRGAARSLPSGARVLCVWENRVYYLERDAIADSFFEASHLMDLVRRAGSAERLAEELDRLGVTHLLYNRSLGSYFGRLYPAADLALLAEYGERYLEILETAGDCALYRVVKRGE